MSDPVDPFVELVTGPVRISVPATSANLGPGFDTLGLALDLRDHLEAEVIGSGLVVEVSGEGAGAVPLDESHLVVRALRRGLSELDASVPGLRLSCVNAVPHARGLGSSSAAIVGGLALARALVVDGAERFDDRTLFAHAAAMEGHPDNVAPAISGGLTISGSLVQAWTTRLDVLPEVSAVALVPPTPLSTEVARGLLPEQVAMTDAVFNVGLAALLVTALTVDPGRLLLATHDALHQHHRAPAMPESAALIAELRLAGVPAVVSGAGPTVLALVAPGSPPVGEVLARCPAGWQALPLAVSPDGVRREA